jgi:Pro-kumamolisin, activation domain/Viral BACON domain/Carbohydrate binding domain
MENGKRKAESTTKKSVACRQPKLTCIPDAITCNNAVLVCFGTQRASKKPTSFIFIIMLQKTSVLRWFIGIALFWLAAWCPVFGGELKTLRDHVPPMLEKMTPLGDLPATNELRLAIGLPLRDPAGLNQFLADVYNPASPNFRKFLTSDEFTTRFGPTAKDYAAVQDFARANGFKITGKHDNRLLLDVQAKAADIQRAFHISLKRFQHPKEARQFFAAVNEPTVDISLPVADISGLNNYQRPYPKLIRKNSASAQAVAKTGSAPTGDYLGDDFRAAYVPGTTLTGAGQMVGLLQFDGFYASDISTYANLAGGGRASIPVKTVLLDGYDGTPSSGNGEVALDIEMSMSMAPGLDKIIVFSGGPNGFQNDILNTMAASNTVKNLSCSWGWSGGPSTTTDNIFQEMAAQGQSFYNASGDSDAFTSGSVNGVDNTRLANAPSSCPYITQVGGTTLTTTGPKGSWSSETVWNWGGGTGSSGGISSYYTIPDWQAGVSMAKNQGSTTHRNIPDVALTADNVYTISDNGSKGSVGGTSCAAPLWAAFTALVNQQATAMGKSPVGFINPAIYGIGTGDNYSQDFYDIATGDNTWSSSPSSFYAVGGYDLCTGWGTPAGNNLITALVGLGDALQVLTTSNLVATGAAGGPFLPATSYLTLTNTGTNDLSWAAPATPATWLAVSPTSGTLAAGTATNVAVSPTAGANTFALGNYKANLSFTNLTSGSTHSVPFTLQVVPALSITPTNGIVFTGPVGGSFSPNSQVFTIGNLGATAIGWKAVETLTWLSLSQSTGLVQAASSATFTASITNANSLKAGAYKGYVTVTSANKKLNVKIPLTLNIGQSIVVNGGFETGDFTGWSLSASSTQVSSTKSYAHSGKYGAQLGQASTLGTLSQTLPTIAGQTYQISLWLANPKNSYGATPNEFQVQWEGNTLFDQSDIPFGTWTNLVFTVTAANSGSVLQLGFRDDPYYLGLDDISVRAITAPHVLNAVASTPTAFHCTFGVTAGATYQAQFTTDLAAPDWQNLGNPVTAGDSTLTVSDTNTANFPQKFYRLQLVAPAP